MNVILCFKVKWNKLDFLLISFIVVYVIVIDWGEIILLVILLLVLVVISKIFGILICWVVVVWSVENSVLVEVFEFVRNIFN